MSRVVHPRTALLPSLLAIGALAAVGFTVAVAEEAATKPSDEKPELPPFEEVSKDHELVAKESFFPLYYDKKKDHLLAVIPEAMLNKNFLVATSIAGGAPFAVEPRHGFEGVVVVGARLVSPRANVAFE